jgi:chemotaxis protein CheC
MNNDVILSEEQLDFLAEMMNIGAGNAAGALSQMLPCKVDLEIPKVHILPVAKAPSVLDDPSTNVACVKMRMVGDISGNMFFIVPSEKMKRFMNLIASAVPGGTEGDKESQSDPSIIMEIGNILAGVYLTSINEFCKLKIYHSAPKMAIDMIQALMDETIVGMSRQLKTIILIENEFIIEEERIKTFLFMIPAADSVQTLVESIEQAIKTTCYG